LGKIGRIEMVGIAGITGITERIGSMVGHRGAVALWVTPAGAKRSPGEGVSWQKTALRRSASTSPPKKEEAAPAIKWTLKVFCPTFWGHFSSSLTTSSEHEPTISPASPMAIIKIFFITIEVIMLIIFEFPKVDIFVKYAINNL